MNSVQARNANAITAPSSTTRAMADLTGRYMNRLEDNPADFHRKLIPASSAPTGVDRAILEERRAELRRSLTPTPGPSVEGVLTLLIAGSPAFGMTERETDAKIMLYAEALRNEPTWAIEAARQLFARGGWKSPWNGRECPSSANVVAEVKHVLLPHEEELYRIGQVLDAELIDNTTTEAERTDAIARWTAIRSEMVGSNVISQRTDAEIAKDRADMRRANERFEGRDYTPMRARRREELGTVESGSVEAGEGRG